MTEEKIFIALFALGLSVIVICITGICYTIADMILMNLGYWWAAKRKKKNNENAKEKANEQT